MALPAKQVPPSGAASEGRGEGGGGNTPAFLGLAVVAGLVLVLVLAGSGILARMRRSRRFSVPSVSVFRFVTLTLGSLAFWLRAV